jgi:CRP-like cAMP-binding protein
MIASKMRPLATTRGIHVAKQGSVADSIFFLQRGAIEVLHLGHPVAHIHAPATFAESALLRGDMEAADKRLSGYRTASTSMCACPLSCFPLLS